MPPSRTRGFSIIGGIANFFNNIRRQNRLKQSRGSAVGIQQAPPSKEIPNQNQTREQAQLQGGQQTPRLLTRNRPSVSGPTTTTPSTPPSPTIQSSRPRSTPKVDQSGLAAELGRQSVASQAVTNLEQQGQGGSEQAQSLAQQAASSGAIVADIRKRKKKQDALSAAAI